VYVRKILFAISFFLLFNFTLVMGIECSPLPIMDCL
jgi:hypothetical protein